MNQISPFLKTLLFYENGWLDHSEWYVLCLGFIRNLISVGWILPIYTVLWFSMVLITLFARVFWVNVWEIIVLLFMLVMALFVSTFLTAGWISSHRLCTSLWKRKGGLALKLFQDIVIYVTVLSAIIAYVSLSKL